MKAATFCEYGGPEVIQIEDVPDCWAFSTGVVCRQKIPVRFGDRDDG